MSTTGLDVFDKTLQTTHEWLKEIMVDLGPDRQVAYRALAAVLHALRDRLGVDEAAHLGAQLPILVRGIYYDQWRPAGKPEKIRSRDEFLARVGDSMSDIRPVNTEVAVRAVFRTLAQRVSEGESEDVRSSLPAPIRQLWPPQTAAEAMAR
jgi:uncharacterized protein (DUF2267 family)